MVYAAVFTAIIAVLAQISIPLGIIVPFTLQTLGVFIASAMLGWKRGTLSVILYVLLGIIGLPVFAGFSGGAAVLFGATGGYIIGFIFTALAVGFMTDKLGRKLWVLAVSMVVGLLLCYIFGTAWFIILYNMQGKAMDIITALGYCVFPFLIADGLKIIVAAVLVNRLDKIIKL
ncbi:MAG: biotin transporter BioY [Clostridia bacterium]|nr:biotin transporter BioY [Clostridia bacterium]